MGKGDIRSRRGKIWRGTYGVTRPQRWKSAPRPATATRKVKMLKDLPKAVAESVIEKPFVEEIQQVTAAEVVDTQTTKAPKKTTAKKTAAKKPAAKKK